MILLSAARRWISDPMAFCLAASFAALISCRRSARASLHACHLFRSLPDTIPNQAKCGLRWAWHHDEVRIIENEVIRYSETSAVAPSVTALPGPCLLYTSDA